MKLELEMVPKTTWNVNLRSMLKKAQWDKVRNICYEKSGYRCDICGASPHKGQLHCHEVWSFDEEKGLQQLSGLESVCRMCHMCKHMGFAVQRHYDGAEDLKFVLDHFLAINDITLDELHEYLTAQFKLWDKRSAREWEVDISFLDDYLYQNGLKI